MYDDDDDTPVVPLPFRTRVADALLTMIAILGVMFVWAAMFDLATDDPNNNPKMNANNYPETTP